MPKFLVQLRKKLKKKIKKNREAVSPSQLPWTVGCGRIPWLCSLSITKSARAPVEHLSLLACVNQTPCSGEGKVENRNRYLSSTQLPKKGSMGRDRHGGGGGGGTVDSVVCGALLPCAAEWSYGWTPTVTSTCSCPLPTFILFIKGTFRCISRLSFCPSPAAIHFNSALVKASWSRNQE